MSLREQTFPCILNHNLLLFKSMHDSLHTSLYLGSQRLNLRTKSLCSIKNRVSPVLWSFFHVFHKKKSLFDCMITSSIIPHRYKPDKHLTHPTTEGDLTPASALTPERQVDSALKNKRPGEWTQILNKVVIMQNFSYLLEVLLQALSVLSFQ